VYLPPPNYKTFKFEWREEAFGNVTPPKQLRQLQKPKKMKDLVKNKHNSQMDSLADLSSSYDTKLKTRNSVIQGILGKNSNLQSMTST
jgi:hypothetical protein